MTASHEFPVILVSVGSKSSANTIISNIIDNEPSGSDENKSTCCRVWRIINKYYTTDVHLHPVIDGDSIKLDQDSVQAHIIYLTENECEESIAERRWAAAPALCGDATRLALAQCGAAGELLAAWARRRRYELVPLLEAAPAADPGEPFPDLCGVPRVRAALHAQRWSSPLSCPQGESETESSDGGEYQSEGEEGAVERMEEFAAMLGVVARGERGRLAELPRGERLRRAEDLVTALCRAMGHDVDHW